MAKALYGLVGMRFRGTEALVASLPQGEPLVLKREPENRFDRNAVQVWARGQHVGYISAKQVAPLAARIDAAQGARGISVSVAAAADEVRAAVSALTGRLAIDGGRWPMVEIDE